MVIVAAEGWFPPRTFWEIVDDEPVEARAPGVLCFAAPLARGGAGGGGSPKRESGHPPIKGPIEVFIGETESEEMEAEEEDAYWSSQEAPETGAHGAGAPAGGAVVARQKGFTKAALIESAS